MKLCEKLQVSIPLHSAVISIRKLNLIEIQIRLLGYSAKRGVVNFLISSNETIQNTMFAGL